MKRIGVSDIITRRQMPVQRSRGCGLPGEDDKLGGRSGGYWGLPSAGFGHWAAGIRISSCSVKCRRAAWYVISVCVCDALGCLRAECRAQLLTSSLLGRCAEHCSDYSH